MKRQSGTLGEEEGYTFDNSAWQRSLHAWFQGVNLLNTAPFKDLHQSIVVKPEWLSKAAFKEFTFVKVK